MNEQKQHFTPTPAEGLNPINREGLFAYFDQMTDSKTGRIDTSADWMADIVMLAISEHDKRIPPTPSPADNGLVEAADWLKGRSTREYACVTIGSPQGIKLMEQYAAEQVSAALDRFIEEVEATCDPVFWNSSAAMGKAMRSVAKSFGVGGEE